MAVAVGHVVELVGPDGAVGFAAGQLFGQALREFHIVVGVGRGHGFDFTQVGAEQAEVVLLFLALGLGHDNDGAIALGVADDGQANTCIARRAFNDHAARFEQALTLGVLDDELRGAVFDGPTRIGVFGFRQDGAAGHFRSLPQLDHRRMTDGGDDVREQTGGAGVG